jgi:hypothetical protein
MVVQNLHLESKYLKFYFPSVFGHILKASREDTPGPGFAAHRQQVQNLQLYRILGRRDIFFLFVLSLLYDVFISKAPDHHNK